MTKKKSPKRQRVTQPKLSLAEYIRRHSPIKAGLRIPDEDEPLTDYDKITDRIYLGNYRSAKDKEFFKKHKIRAVLNCTKDVPNHFCADKKIEYMRIPVDDSLEKKDFDLMYEFLPIATEFIHKHAVIQKNNILVNCVAGRQRSAINVACYLVTKHGLNPHDACKFVLEKRPEAFHFGKSLNFDQALNKHYKKRVNK